MVIAILFAVARLFAHAVVSFSLWHNLTGIVQSNPKSSSQSGMTFGSKDGDNRMPFAEILTERLAVRQLVASDAQRIFEYRSLPEVARFQSWGIQSREEIQSQIKSLSLSEPGVPGSWYQIAIALRSSGELIGDFGFHVLGTEPRQAEFGISLAPEYQFHGYATEALSALLNYLLVGLGKHRAFGSVDPRNLRSIKLMQRVGMRMEAHFVKSLWFKGEWVDDMIFAVLASDWTNRNREQDMNVRV